jgi:LDH2 family malate/lactate/ureidoglycolate dehydrogenase
VNDVGAIAAAMAGHDALLLVDAVSSFGGMACALNAKNSRREATQNGIGCAAMRQHPEDC